MEIIKASFDTESKKLKSELIQRTKTGERFNLELAWRTMKNNKRYLSIILYGFNSLPRYLGIVRLLPPLTSESILNSLKTKLKDEFGLKFEIDIFGIVTVFSELSS